MQKLGLQLPSLRPFQSPENCQDAWKSGTRISSFGETEDQCITSKRGSNTYRKQNSSQNRGLHDVTEGGQTNQKSFKRHVHMFAKIERGRGQRSWLKLASFQHDIQIDREREKTGKDDLITLSRSLSKQKVHDAVVWDTHGTGESHQM